MLEEATYKIDLYIYSRASLARILLTSGKRDEHHGFRET